MRKPHLKPVTVGILQALGVFLYIVLFTVIIQTFGTIANNIPEYFAPVIALLTFSFSALLCAFITLTRPIILLFRQRYRDAIVIIASMLMTMAVLLLFSIGSILLYHTMLK